VAREKRPASGKAAGKNEEVPGLPDPAAILEETQFTSPKGHHYRILKTNERDAYDEPAEKRIPPGKDP
jgi:hypothetical protein